MKRLIFAFIAGGFFGAGLLISGMTNTEKVQNWLDFFGNWDPTLAFVMGGAIIPMAIAWRIRARMVQPLAGQSFPNPPDPKFDPAFIAGSIMFGMGWALVGLCPGPVIASLSFGGTPVLIFLAAMIAGMILSRFAKGKLDSVVATH